MSLFGIFDSKNKKLVTHWEEDHVHIVESAHKIIALYNSHELVKAKKELLNLNHIVGQHLMNEDIELYKLLKDEKRQTSEIKKDADKFKESFRDTKKALMKFLNTYTKKEAILDETFFEEFMDIIDVVAARIEFEENNLYVHLVDK